MPDLRFFLLLATVIAAAGLTIAGAAALAGLQPGWSGWAGTALVPAMLALVVMARARR